MRRTTCRPLLIVPAGMPLRRHSAIQGSTVDRLLLCMRILGAIAGTSMTLQEQEWDCSMARAPSGEKNAPTTRGYG